VGFFLLLFFFLNKKLLTLQHFSAADQKSSSPEQHLSSSPLHIVPFKKSKFIDKTLMEKEACFPPKGNKSCKTFQEFLVNSFANQYVS